MPVWNTFGGMRGTVIDELGNAFANEEKSGMVLNFPLSKRHKEMLQPLNPINYIRNYVPRIT